MRYEFVPQPDITAYEIAIILAKAHMHSDGDPPEIVARHFLRAVDMKVAAA